MHAVVRAMPLALGLIASCAANAASAELPPIFVSRDAASSSEPMPVRGGSARAHLPLSERMRAVMGQASSRALETAVAFESPAPASAAAPPRVDPQTGTTIMAPFVVRGRTPRESEVEVPTLRLMHFTPEPPDKERRIAGGATAPLYRTFIGNKELRVELSIFNLAGKGIDHNIDFSRAELAFKLKW